MLKQRCARQADEIRELRWELVRLVAASGKIEPSDKVPPGRRRRFFAQWARARDLLAGAAHERQRD
jgi:hypothetical protein